MIRRHELSDPEWDFVRPLLPASLRGPKRLDDRMVLNGILWKFRTGVAWRDVPERYGSWATLHTRFRRWAKERHLHPHAPGRPGQSGRGWRHRLTGLGRVHHRAGPPARRRSPEGCGVVAVHSRTACLEQSPEVLLAHLHRPLKVTRSAPLAGQRMRFSSPAAQA
ncbi:transposase [Streptomyces afghaniensis]|uniref:transposase n=1 Tax=Streptomyces afghaniensis TaxID=66865 RepID=UPI00358F09EE